MLTSGKEYEFPDTLANGRVFKSGIKEFKTSKISTAVSRGV
jgi:hypothetical protein